MINSLQRSYERGLFLTTLEKNIILTRVKLHRRNGFTMETKDWSTYWKPVYELNQRKVTDCIDNLNVIWNEYISSGLNASKCYEYCYRYFLLLEALLSANREFNTEVWKNSVQLVLGFECFGITAATNEPEVLAAGTSTLRNPCYLLAKLKMPNVLDTPQFLPMITVPDSEKLELFFHYRQYSLSLDSQLSLFLYPAVSGTRRSASFKLINKFICELSYEIDPRIHERSQRLLKHIILPLIKTNSKGDLASTHFELVDVGAGSGNFSAAVCRGIQSRYCKAKVRLWFIDLESAELTRFFRNGRLRNIIDNISFLSDDYRNWLSRPKPLPVTNWLRIAFITKLFNNLSNFHIRSLSDHELSSIFGNIKMDLTRGQCQPSICLAPEGPGIKYLSISKSRIYLNDGRAFFQASLSEFYRGLYLLQRGVNSDLSIDHGFFLPVRSFNPECLITYDNKSIIARLAEYCDHIVIEDADLDPETLVTHMLTYKLNNFAIWNMTKSMKLKGNYLYTISTETISKISLSGKRIW